MSVEMDKDKLNAILSMCAEAERLAIERAAELDAIKTALGCQGMNLADVLKVIDVMQTAAIQDVKNQGETTDERETV